MATNYPGGFDSLSNPSGTDPLDASGVPHASQHANANDAIEAIEATLGLNPQSSWPTVNDRIAAVQAGSITPGVITWTSPGVISVNSASDALRITQTGSGNALVVEDSANPDATPFVVDASGSVGIGTSAPANSLVVYNGNGVIDATRFVNNTGTGPTLITRKSASATVGTHASMSNGEVVGRLIFQGSDGTTFIDAASVRAEVDGTPGTNDMPGRLVFSTTADGASSPTERMRITNAGNVGIGTSSPTGLVDAYKASGDAVISVSGDSSAYYVARQAVTSTSGPLIFLDKARGTIASPSVVSSGDTVGLIRFRGHDGTAFRNLAQVQADVDGTPGLTDMPGRLVFSTTPDNSTTLTERMRIDNAGLITGTGTSLGAWTAYTPTLGGTGWAIGNGTVTAVYSQIGKWVAFSINVTFGSTSTFGAGSATLTVPGTMKSSDRITVNAWGVDTSLSQTYALMVTPSSTSAFFMGTIGTNGLRGGVISSNPFTWADTDVIRVTGFYEAA